MKLEIGKKAPTFTLPNQDEDNVSLKDYEGSWLVLYFYPRDDTPGCTLEAITFTGALKKFQAQGAEIVGISPDAPEKHCKFMDKHKLKVTLLSDVDNKVQEKYGVRRTKMLYGKSFLGVVRTTLLIDPKGKIAHIWDNVKVKGHVDAVLTKLKELN